MESLFKFLTDALTLNLFAAMAASFVWGVLSIVLSPCHLSSIPLIVAYISGDKSQDTRRAALTAGFFAFGILLSIGVIGGVTALLGRIAGDIGTIGNYAVALVFLVFGLHLMDIIPLPFNAIAITNRRARGLVPALIMGLVFGLALGPCTFAFLAPVLGIVFNISDQNPLYGTALILLFGIGHSLVIVVAGTSIQGVQKLLNLNNRTSTLTWLRRVCGILVVLGGLYLIAIT